ncbi:MAG: DMT family transporter [Alphaproteobacteria bacterium]|nr:DMT family transporter [Alphaproteobacteria bacterium]
MIGSAAFFGAGAAIFWGVSDIVARFSGRSIGVLVTTLALMIVGTIAMIVFALGADAPMDWNPDGYWLIALSGSGVAIGTLLIFSALTRGPVSLASPTVASYPAIAVPLSVALGARPDLIHWLAMAGTMIGVWLVAYSVGNKGNAHLADYGHDNIRRTLILSIVAAFIFAVAILAADFAIDRYGWLQTLIGSRMSGIFIIGAVMLVRREAIGPVPPKAWPLLLIVGVLDTGGHAVLYLGLSQPNGEFAVVASAAATGVTTMIARVFLREPVAPIQWLGIVAIIAGIAALNWLG